MSDSTKASSSELKLIEQYKKAGEDYTGLAEFSDISKFNDGYADYTIKSHGPRVAGCRGLKPDTKVYVRFDGKNLADYVKPYHSDYTTASGGLSYGDQLVTNSRGQVTFHFKIPNDANLTFKGMKHLLEVSDVPPPVGSGISSGKEGATTRCGQFYYTPSNRDIENEEEYKKQISSLAGTELTADASATIVKNTAVAAEVPDFLSQSFFLSKGKKETVSIKYIDLFFLKKPYWTGAGITVQIRKTGKQGRPTDHVLAQSIELTGSNIKESNDGDGTTRFSFDDLVVLKNNEQYAITVIPNEKATDYKIWTAHSDDKVVSTYGYGSAPYWGPRVRALYGSATGDQWAKLPRERLKFDIHYAQFDTSVTSTTVLENQKLEFLDITNIIPAGKPTGTTGFQVDEEVLGESILAITTTDTSLTIGDIITNAVAKDNALSNANRGTYAHGIVRSAPVRAGGVETFNIDSIGDFAVGATVYKNGVVFAGAGTVSAFTKSTVSGKVTFINTDYGRLRLTESTGGPSPAAGFRDGDNLRGQTWGAQAEISDVVNLSIDEVDLRTPFTAGYGTNLDWYIKASSGAGTLDSAWQTVTGGTGVEFSRYRKSIFSASNKADSTLRLKAEMSTGDESVSPVFEWEDVTLSTTQQRLNGTDDNEETTSGSAEARYTSGVFNISKPQSGDPSERITMMAQCYLPPGSKMSVYIRAKNNNDVEELSDKKFTKLGNYRSFPKQNSTAGNRQDFILQHFQIPKEAASDNFQTATGVDNTLREKTSSKVVSYRSSDGSLHSGIDKAQVKVVFTREEGRGTIYVPHCNRLVVVGHKVPVA